MGERGGGWCRVLKPDTLASAICVGFENPTPHLSPDTTLTTHHRTYHPTPFPLTAKLVKPKIVLRVIVADVLNNLASPVDVVR